MMVRPGQHVDPQGKIYHPYLAGWAEFDVSRDFLKVNGQASDILIEVEYYGFFGDSA
jgi:UEV domain